MSETLLELDADPAIAETSAASVPDDRPPTRDRHGRFTRGNGAAISHGAYSRSLPPEFAHLRDEITTFLQQAIADDGGESEISARRKTLLEYRARVHRRISQIDDALELHGLVDRRGKLRVTWLSQLASLIATAKSLDGLLGLQRRDRQVPTLADYLDARSIPPIADPAADPLVHPTAPSAECSADGAPTIAAEDAPPPAAV